MTRRKWIIWLLLLAVVAVAGTCVIKFVSKLGSVDSQEVFSEISNGMSKKCVIELIGRRPDSSVDLTMIERGGTGREIVLLELSWQLDDWTLVVVLDRKEEVVGKHLWNDSENSDALSRFLAYLRSLF